MAAQLKTRAAARRPSSPAASQDELRARGRELAEALEQQRATSEILSIISRSQTDAQPVFDTIASSALRLCGARSANVFTFDGKLLHAAALAIDDPHELERMRRAWPRPLGRDTAATRAVLTRSGVAIPDVLEDPDYGLKDTAVASGFRSVVSMPLLRDGRPIGAIAVGRSEPGPFPPKQIALLQTFADQAVIAIENTRLFRELEARNRELTEALEQRTATSEILRVISGSPSDVQPVFQTIADAALKLCDAAVVNMVTYDGRLLHIGALAMRNPEGLEAARRVFPRPPGPGTATGMAVLARDVVSIPDVLVDSHYAFRDGARFGVRSVLGIPLLRDGAPIGALAICRPEPGPLPDAQIALLKTFADQAVIAIENARLFRELEARTRELTRSVERLRALSDVGQAVSSTLELETVLATIVARATQLTEMDGGAIYEYDEVHEQFRLCATDRLPDELVEELRAAPIAKGEGAIGRLAVTHEPVTIGDLVDERAYQSRVRGILLRLGYRSLLAVPLLREHRLLGGLVVNRRRSGAFDAGIIDLMRTVATQSALAIQNARLFREIEDKSRQLEVASGHKSAFLANMSHELRTPLNAIIGFTRIVMRRSQQQLEAKQYENLEKILASAQHLLALINSILDLAKVEAGRIELRTAELDLGPVLEQCLRTVEPLLRDGVVLERAVADGLPRIVVDEEKLRQIVMNLLSNAVKFTERGSVRLGTRVAGEAIEIAVADTGIGIPPDKLESIFEEFEQVDSGSTRAFGGTGLGLAIARRLARLMGGDVHVASTPGAGSTFTLMLPLRAPDPR